jgi:hypothetical protein
LEYCGNEGVNFASKIIQIYGARLWTKSLYW